MKIDGLMTSVGASNYYDSDFRAVLEDHMTYLGTHPQTTVTAFSGAELEKYYGDLSGLLATKNIPRQHHWIIMRMNQMTAMTELNASHTSLLIPNAQVIDMLLQAFMTQRRIKN